MAKKVGRTPKIHTLDKDKRGIKKKKKGGKMKSKDWSEVNKSLTSKPLPVKKAKPPKEAKDVGHLPKTYTLAADGLKMMSEQGGSAGSIVVKNFKSYNVKHIYALVMNTVKNLPVIKKLIHELKLMKLYSNINPFLLEIIVGDLLFGKGLKEVAQTTYAAKLLAQKPAIEKKYNSLASQYQSSDAGSLDIKYLRVNTLKSTISSVVHDLKALGLTQLVYDKEKIKFKKFCNKFKLMPDNQFMLDFHFPNDLILVRSASVRKIKSSDLIKKGKIVMQDKASFLAVEAMQVKPDMTILDACCAPGMKTSAIAAKMNNKGKIFAFDLNKGRLASAEHLLKIQGVRCAKLACQDFSSVKIKKLLDGNKQAKFDAILIDPSCSGSGIHNRPDYKSSTEAIDRLKKLQAFQVALLVHAIDDGHADNIVYSTCSTATEENEQVIKMSLDESKFGQRWQVAEIVPYWPHRGHGEYEFAPKCIRSDQDCLTNGFFVAKLERKTEVVNKEESNGNVKDEESLGGEESEDDAENEETSMDEEGDDEEGEEISMNEEGDDDEDEDDDENDENGEPEEDGNETEGDDDSLEFEDSEDFEEETESE